VASALAPRGRMIFLMTVILSEKPSSTGPRASSMGRPKAVVPSFKLRLFDAQANLCGYALDKW
jgi:hypothetical protein